MIMKRPPLRIRKMSRQAYLFLLTALILSAVMLLCAFAVTVHMLNTAPESRTLLYLAQELYSAPQGILLISCIGWALLEDRSRR